MKKPTIKNQKSVSVWYDEGHSAIILQKRAIYKAIDEFTDFANSANVTEHLHELLSEWLTNPDNKNASAVEITNTVYMTTRIMAFMSIVLKEWETMRYIVLRDKGIES